MTNGAAQNATFIECGGCVPSKNVPLASLPVHPELELELELEALNLDQSSVPVVIFFTLSSRLDCVPSKNVPLAGLPVHPEHLVGGSPQLRVRVSVEPLGKKPYQCLTFIQSLIFDEHVTHSTSTSK